MIKRFIIWFFILPNLLLGQVLNEVCSSNQTVLEDVNEGFKDWVEIYNNTATALNLGGYYLSNDLGIPDKWECPAVSIPAYDYLVLLSNPNSSLAASINFAFRRRGFTLYLFDPNLTLIDSLLLPELHPDHSYGRQDGKLYYYGTPSPGEINSSQTGYKGYAREPSFSAKSGLFSGTNIIISAKENQQAFYSFDGSDPLQKSIYNGPISIDQTRAIRSRCIGDSLLPSKTVYRTYFVNKHHALPVVSLTADSLALFDSLTGIYMLGPNANPNYPFYGANFWKDTAILVNYEYFDEGFDLKESMECELKIHGGTVSSTQPLKSFRLVARNHFEKDAFVYPYFENKPTRHFRRLLLRNSGSDYNYTHLKDGIIHNFIIDHHLNIDVQGYRPVVVYLNGNYWGVLNLREKFDKYYPESNYFVNPDSVNLLEENNLILIDGDSADFVSLLNFVEKSDMTNQHEFAIVETKLDVNSMVDYFVVECFLNNRDWPYNNLKLWNAGSEHPRWRYLLSDLDAAAKYWGDEEIDRNSLEHIFGTFGDNNIHVRLLKQLFENSEFKRYFVNRYADLMNTIFQADYMLNYIYLAKKVIEPEMPLHFQHWWGIDWDENFQHYDNFFEDRVEIERRDLENTMNVGEAVEIYVGVFPGGAGSVRLNTLELDSFPFTGHYFPTNYIDLTAKSTQNDKFLYWENLTNGDTYFSRHILVDPEEGDSLVAVFEQLESSLLHLRCYPNPTSDEAYLSFSLPSSLSPVISVSSLNGQVLMQEELGYLAKGSHTIRLKTEEIANGVYLLNIWTEMGAEGIKLVVRR